MSSNPLSRKELVTKLENIDALYTNIKNLEHRMAHYEPEDNYPRQVVLPPFPIQCRTNKPEEERNLWVTAIPHEHKDAPRAVQEMHRKYYAPKAPEEPKMPVFKEVTNSTEKEKQNKNGCLSKGLFAVAGFFALGFIVNITDPNALTILLIAAVAGAAGFFFHLKAKAATGAIEKANQEAFRQHKEQKAQIEAAHKAKVEEYNKQCAEYEVALQAFMEQYAAWRQVYLQHYEEEQQIKAQLEQDRQATLDKIHAETYAPALATLKEYNDLLSEEYLPVAGEIAGLIKSGRADNMKEAVNLYEDILYRERQEQFEREKEANRHEEEQRRLEAQERQHQEEMEFMEAQERQRAREAKAQQEAQERQHKEMMEQRDREAREEKSRREAETRRQQNAELDRQRREDAATRNQCNTCSLNSRCSMSYRRPNCASYRPR